MAPEKNQIPPSEMLSAIHAQVGQIGQRSEEQARLGGRVEATLRSHTQRFVDLNEAVGRIEGKVVKLDLEVAGLKEDLAQAKSDIADHHDRIVEIERTRYQRPTPRVSLVDAAERVSNSIVPGRQSKADLGILTDTGSFRVQPDVLDKLLAERDAAKILAEDKEAKLARKKLKESVLTAVCIALTLAFLTLLGKVLLAQAQHDPPVLAAPHEGH
jgi:hypothetical protein